MMKKFLMFLILFLLPMTVCLAYPRTLENGNLVLVYGHMDCGGYLDRSSAVVQVEDPPCYQIAIDWVMFKFSPKDGYNSYSLVERSKIYFRYNADDKSKIYHSSTSNVWGKWDLNEWTKFDVNVTHSSVDSYILPAADVAFEAVYGKKFFLDDWVYRDYRSNDYYVNTSSIVNNTKYRLNRRFSVYVKKVRDGQLISTDRFDFDENDGMLYFEVNGGERNFVKFDGKTPVAASVWKYCVKYLGLDYKVTMEDR